MNDVIAAGYIGVTAPDLDEWRSFATEVLGLAIGEGPDVNRLYLRIDERAWRISVSQGSGGLDFCGWEVANAASLASVAASLDESGIAYDVDGELAKERGVVSLIKTTDPAGNQVEIFWGSNIPKQPFVSPTGATFVTSHRAPGDLGYGHAVILVPGSAEATKHFYLDVLGFRLSDTITPTSGAGPKGVEAVFTHVNPRHHSLGFVGVPDGPATLHHFMLEVADLDMVGRAYDRVGERSIEFTSTLGKHTNDHMTSFYAKTPSGFAVEYGTGGRLIDDDVWITSTYDAVSYWGHQHVAGE